VSLLGALSVPLWVSCELGSRFIVSVISIFPGSWDTIRTAAGTEVGQV